MLFLQLLRKNADGWLKAPAKFSWISHSSIPANASWHHPHPSHLSAPNFCTGITSIVLCRELAASDETVAAGAWKHPSLLGDEPTRLLSKVLWKPLPWKEVCSHSGSSVLSNAPRFSCNYKSFQQSLEVLMTTPGLCGDIILRWWGCYLASCCKICGGPVIHNHQVNAMGTIKGTSLVVRRFLPCDAGDMGSVPMCLGAT